MHVNAANNRLVGYSYDANGNMTGMSGTSFTYDVANRIATVLPSGGGTEQYSYGPDSLRVWKLAADGTEELHFYGVLGERLGTYRIANNYGRGYKVFQGPINGYFAGKIIWSQLTDIGGGVVYGTGREVAQNRLGSVAGSYPNGSYYYPYGEDSGTPLLGDNFATYYRDGTTGLDYAKNRYYSPILGRFLSPDPYRVSGGPADPGSWNRYAYVGNDPVNFDDSSGTFKSALDSACHLDESGLVQCTPLDDLSPQYLFKTNPGLFNAFMARGGGGGVTKPALPKLNGPVEKAQQREFSDALSDALGRLWKTKCAGLFKADATAKLKSATFNYGAIPVDTSVSQNGLAPETWFAATNKEANTVTVNLIGHFFNLIVAVGDGKAENWKAALGDLAAQLSDVDFRALVLLHELGHLTDTLGDDTKNPDLSDAFNKSILSDCFGKK